MGEFSIYPDAIDGYSQLPLAVDGVTSVSAVSINRLREAILNIESELGVLPSDDFDTVSARLDDIEASIANLGVGNTFRTYAGNQTLSDPIANTEDSTEFSESVTITGGIDVGDIIEISGAFTYSADGFSAGTPINFSLGSYIQDQSGGVMLWGSDSETQLVDASSSVGSGILTRSLRFIVKSVPGEVNGRRIYPISISGHGSNNDHQPSAGLYLVPFPDEIFFDGTEDVKISFFWQWEIADVGSTVYQLSVTAEHIRF